MGSEGVIYMAIPTSLVQKLSTLNVEVYGLSVEGVAIIQFKHNAFQLSKETFFPSGEYIPQ